MITRRTALQSVALTLASMITRIDMPEAARGGIPGKPAPDPPPTLAPTPPPASIDSISASQQPSASTVLATWETHMIEYGKKHGDSLMASLLAGSPSALDERLGATYYDAESVFLKIASYTGDDATWLPYAQAAQIIYLDQYAIPNNGGVPGYWNFTDGLRTMYERTGETHAKDGVILISQNAAYTLDVTPLDWTVDASRSREVAYTIRGFLNSESVGFPRRDRLADFATQALGHLEQWFGPTAVPGVYMQPFMVGLTCRALIQYDEIVGDTRILPAIQNALDAMWTQAWRADFGSFFYESSNPAGVTADLNLLICPAYAWLYKRSGDANARDRGDQIFAGGVNGAWLEGPKQFNQNYTWSFEYVAWRS